MSRSEEARLLRAALREDFSDFLENVFPTLEPGSHCSMQPWCQLQE